MSFEPCPKCGNTTGRDRVQLAKFFEDADHGTDVQDWSTLLRDECAECGHVIFEHDLYSAL